MDAKTLEILLAKLSADSDKRAADERKISEERFQAMQAASDERQRASDARIEELLQQRQPRNNENANAHDSTAFKVKCLADSMVQFDYDPDSNQTFEAFYKRYESVLTTQAIDLDEPTKVHLLLQKFPQAQYQRYADSILPLNPQDCTLAQTVVTLKRLFGYKETKFAMRHKCFNLSMCDSEDFSEYAARVNKYAEKFDIAHCTNDDFKVLLFVCGLKSSKVSLILEKLLTKIDNQHVELEKAANDQARELIHKLNLQDLVNEAERITCLKLDKGKIGETSSTAEVHAVKINSYNKEKPKNTYQSDKSKTESSAPCYSPCPACGEVHWYKNCLYKETCETCNKKGHKSIYCSSFKLFLSRPRASSFNKSGSAKVNALKVNSVTNRKFINPLVNGAALKLQYDTASDMTIISKANWKILGEPKLTVTLRTNATSASGNNVPLLGGFKCNIKLNNCEKNGFCYVTPLDLNLFGIPWINAFNLWSVPVDAVCHQVSSSSDILTQEVLKKFPKLFSNELGCFNKSKVSLQLKEGSKPIFRNARPVPQAARQVIATELERLQHLGIISPIKHSQWAAPIVAVKKKNGKIRICADYSTGLNEALEPNKYPLPTPDIIFANFSGKTRFSTMDISDAFFQIEVDDKSKQLMAINTHIGLFQVNRLQQGIKTAPGEFQAIVDMMLSGISTFGFIDDMVTGGENELDHKKQLFKTMQQIEDFGFKLNINKCNFGKESVEFCGHIIDSKGIRPHPEKIWEVKSAPRPVDVPQLRSFLGSVNYYGKFIKSMKQLRGPLDNLLKNEVKFEWTTKHEETFKKLKDVLASDLVLTHFDPKKDIVLASDASKDGMGAALMHKFKDGSLHPIMHFAATFTEAEKNYSQIEKEARALIFGLKRSHFYIAGRRFTAHVDHKPLLAIFGSKTGIPVYTANRLQRWALIVMAYDIKFEFIGTNSFGYVDVVSRLMSKCTKPDEEIVIANIHSTPNSIEDLLCFAIQSAKELPVKFEDIQTATKTCPALQKVCKYVTTDSWPQRKQQIKNMEVADYFIFRNDLKVAHDCLFRGEQLVIPKTFREHILKELHEGHPGECRMKLLAADKVFWPKLSLSIEKKVKTCEKCAKAGKAPKKVPLQLWPMPAAPWCRVHLDYAGPINGFFFLVIVDAYSKWPEVYKTSTTTATKTVEIFDNVLARHGLCELVVTDNGPQFVSSVFENFLKNQGIKHLTTAYYSPQSNGQAERFVDLLKKGLQKAEGNLDQKLREFLLTYRYTPSYNLGMKSPFELMSGRKMRTKLDLLKPNAQASSLIKSKMKTQFDDHHGTKWKEFNDGDEIYYQLHSTNNWKWIPGIVKSRTGMVNYTVEIFSPDVNRIVKAHANQLKRRYNSNELIELFDLPDFDDNHKHDPTGEVQPVIVPDNNHEEFIESDDDLEFEDAQDEAQDVEEAVEADDAPRYPVRANRGINSRLTDFVRF